MSEGKTHLSVFKSEDSDTGKGQAAKSWQTHTVRLIT